MQGFPDEYVFPVSKTQGIKQLGNSVAIDAVQEVAKQMLRHLKTLNSEKPEMIETKNKGEWTELLVFVKLLAEQKLFLSDKELNKKVDFFSLKKVTTRNLDLDFYIIDKSTIQSVDFVTKEKQKIDISELLTEKNLNSIKDSIINGKSTFTIPEFDIIQKKLGFDVIKGGTSIQKSDIVLDIQNAEIEKENEGFGIKSYLGSKPTLLNASGNTNFIFRIDGFDHTKIDEVNEITNFVNQKCFSRLQSSEMLLKPKHLTAVQPQNFRNVKKWITKVVIMEYLLPMPLLMILKLRLQLWSSMVVTALRLQRQS